MVQKFKSVEQDWDWQFWQGKLKKKDTHECDNKIPLAVVYCVWQNPLYLRFLAYSIVTQYKFTDIKDTNLFIFVDKKIEQEAKQFSKIFGLQVNICDYPINKYTITTLEQLQGMHGIVLCDTDTFFCGKFFPIYKTLLSLNDIYMMEDRDSAVSVFLSRKVLSDQLSKCSKKEYVNSIANMLKISQEDLLLILSQQPKWFLSCFAYLPTKYLKNDKWHEHVKRFIEIQSYCDETVFLTYAWINNYTVKNLNEIKGVQVALWTKYLDIMKNNLDNVLYISHPLHGTTSESDDIKDWYQYLLTIAT